MPIVGADFLDPKRELLDDMINKVDRVSLREFKEDSECPEPHRVIDRRILEASNFLTLISNESQELNIRLDVMSRHLLVVYEYLLPPKIKKLMHMFRE
tara:strand:+ start:1881 stop:2174 length:294 start_codon:yes stop_codon:yes gene_type:complete